jgi:2-methylisocitrate lyase-like PEP mutase family enzyme
MQPLSLADQAGTLLGLHHGPRPLVLPNAWDAETARLVEAAGFPAIATSSSAIAASLGERDGDVIDPDLAFEAVRRISGSVSVPVTADIEAGYSLEATELVERLVGAGAVGCNLEDTDHHGPGPLVRPEEHASRIEQICRAAELRGVPIVVNARVDVFIRAVGAPDTRVSEALRRGRMYLAAGAACVFPIGVIDRHQIAALVDGMGGPVNVMLAPQALSLRELGELRVARISLARGLQRIAAASIARALRALSAGDSDSAFGVG